MRFRLGFLLLVGVLVACGGSVANDPSSDTTKDDTAKGASSSGGSGSGATGGGSTGSRGPNSGSADPSPNGQDPKPDCPPSAHPPNSPDCPATFRGACHSDNPAPQVGPIECWYPGQGDGTSNGCWSDALFQCREADDGDGGKALRCACAQ